MATDVQVLPANQIITFDQPPECAGRVRFDKGDEPNIWHLYYQQDDLLRSVDVAVSKGSFTEIGGPVTYQTQRHVNYAALDDEAFGNIDGAIVLDTIIYKLHYGVYEEKYMQTYQAYEYYEESAARACGECQDGEEEEDIPAQVVGFAIYDISNGLGPMRPCASVAFATVGYDCPVVDLCPDGNFSLSISGGDNNTFYIEAPAGISGEPVVSIDSSVSVGFGLIGSETYDSESIEEFSQECEVPQGDILFSVEIDDLHYGFMKSSEERTRFIYQLTYDGEEYLVDPEPVSVFAYMYDDGCYGAAQSVVEVRSIQGPRPDNPCWVRISLEGKKLVHVTYGGSFRARRPTVRAVNASLEYMGVLDSESEDIVEFTNLLFEPPDALFSIRTRSGVSGFRVEKNNTTALLYEVQPENPEGSEPIFVYAYMDGSRYCYGYDQIMVPPPNDEPQFEEHTAYQVVSRIVVVQEGAFAAPYLDDGSPTFTDLLEKDGRPFLMVERVHESGYIHQFWREDYARVETTHYPHLPRHRLWEGGDNPDLYIKWTSPSLEGNPDMNADTKPGGRELLAVYNRLRDVGDIPRGVSRRWGMVKVAP